MLPAMPAAAAICPSEVITAYRPLASTNRRAASTMGDIDPPAKPPAAARERGGGGP